MRSLLYGPNAVESWTEHLQVTPCEETDRHNSIFHEACLFQFALQTPASRGRAVSFTFATSALRCVRLLIQSWRCERTTPHRKAMNLAAIPSTVPQWQQLAIYAVAIAAIVMLLQRIPVIGRFIRFAVSLCLFAFLIFVLLQQAPYQPELSRLTEGLGLDGQRVSGNEL